MQVTLSQCRDKRYGAIFKIYSQRKKSAKKYIYIKLSHTSTNHLHRGMLPGLRTMWRRAKGAVDRHCLSPRTPAIIQRFSCLSQEPETFSFLIKLISAVSYLDMTGSYQYLQAPTDGEVRCHQPQTPGSSTASSVPIKATQHHPSCDPSRQR